MTRDTINPICYRCGARKFRTAEKIGHIARACRSRTVSNFKAKNCMQDPEEFCEREDTSYSLFVMQDKARDPIVVLLALSGTPLDTKLDTARSVTHFDQ